VLFNSIIFDENFNELFLYNEHLYGNLSVFETVFPEKAVLQKKTQRLIIEFKINMETELKIDGNQE
jgi:hypothetical protein